MNKQPSYKDLIKRVKVLQNTKNELNKAVSERAYFEKQSTVLLENSPVCTKIVDLDYNLQYMSSAGIKALSIEDVTKLYGRPFPLKFYPEHSKREMIENLDKAKNTGEVFTFESDLIISDGSRLWFQSTLVPVLNDKEQVEYIMVVSADITKQKSSDERLKEINEEIMRSKNALQKETEAAQAANLAKSEFLASMSHELRTPMNAVLGFAQMLQYDPSRALTDRQDEYVEHIIEGGNHLLELINDVLDLSKIEAQQLSLNVEQIVCNEVIDEILVMTAPLADRRKLKVIDRFRKIPTIELLADKTRYKQCLFNLLSNAVKYNRDEGVIIVDGYETEDNYLRVSISDTGLGIARKDYDHVFQMFHRLEGNATIAKEGAGIGLAVTKMLVEQMDGRIGFESQFGVGSNFWIELPLANVASAEEYQQLHA